MTGTGKKEINVLDRTLGSLLNDPLIAEIAPDAIRGRDLINEEICGLKLREVSWPGMERGFSRLLEVASRGQYYYPLYSGEECGKTPEKRGVNLVHFPSDDPKADGRPFILLVPGGGFVNVWNISEGWPIAQHFNEKGYHVFILTYRVNVAGTAAGAMEDISRALTLIGENAAEFRVDPGRYITCGFSAGGYIVCLWNTEIGYPAYGLAKPEACFPVYPFVSYRLASETMDAEPERKDGFARSASGLSLTETVNSCFEIPDHVEGFPPTAIFLAAKDEGVGPEHSKLLAKALNEAGIACRLEIGETGGHGFADGTGMCMEGWPERAIDWFEGLESGN